MISVLDTLALVGLVGLSALALGCAAASPTANAFGGSADGRPGPYVLVLGVGQDGGSPQAGTTDPARWNDPGRRATASSIALVDPRSGHRWLFDATPDLPEQLHRLDRAAPPDPDPAGPARRDAGLTGIFLTHAHMGHYLGLAHLGREVMGTRGVPVHAMPRMADFLRTNGPWSQLVELGNIELRPLTAGAAVRLAADLSVTPLLVPHRDEFSETVAFRIDGPERSVLYLPDIDKWERWDEQGTRLEDILATVDVAYLDGTFFADGEIPGRSMADIPHPFIEETLNRLRGSPATTRGKVRFIHLNHTNPALDPASDAARQVREEGFELAREGERVTL